MMRKAILLAALLFLALPADAQQSTYGAITAAASTCTGNENSAQCVRLQMPANQATVAVTVLGTFTATLAVERSANHGGSWVSAGGNLTSTGTTTYSVAGYTDFRVRGDAYTSGSAKTTITSSSASSGSITSGSGVPSGSCGPEDLYVRTGTGDLYDCLSGAWSLAGGGATSVLDGITFDLHTAPPILGDTLCFNASIVGVPCALSTAFTDSTFYINGSVNATKQLQFDVDTDVPASTVITVKAPAAAGTIPTTTALTSLKVWTCEIVVGDPGAASSVLADDNDTPDVCANDTAVTKTITAVHCYANTGSPTVTPIVNGGGATTILSGAGTCDQTAGGASLPLQGTPTLTTGQLVDMNITTAGGAAKYIVVRISGTKP